MRCLVRAGLPPRSLPLCFRLLSRPTRRSSKAGSTRRRSARSADRKRRRQCWKACRHAGRDADAAFQKNDFRAGMRCSADSSPPRRMMRRAGCGRRAPYCRSSRAMTGKKHCCRSCFDRRLRRVSALALPQRRSEQPSVLGRRCRPAAVARRARFLRLSLELGKPELAASTKNGGLSTVSGCSTIRSIRIRSRRAPASIFQRTARRRTDSSLCRRSGYRTNRDRRRARSSFASRASSTANATR